MRTLNTSMLLFAITCFCGPASSAPAQANPHADPGDDITDTDLQAAAQREAAFLSKTRQLTFEGRRAGEGYFSQDGSQLVFQSEREPGNPFFQIYVMDMETGDVERISPGHGKTTCAWIHPAGTRVLYASTQSDLDARKKQQAEIDLRAEGKQRRYSWDYDEHFELYDYDREAGEYRNLTSTRGYDAEASWSPDGQLIAFTSNRRAYEGDLTDEEKKHFEIDPAYMNDLYLMNADGSDVRRLTKTPGYDGGPFFSPDGARLCWRRFTPDGAIAEVWTMNVDGSDKRQLTRLGAMSWAPYYHPSGEYLIFTTNKHGFANFELYLIDAAGKSAPVRVTHTKGFDGLPVFTPNGKQLAWTTNRTPSKQSQIFIADWSHERARELLGLDKVAALDDESIAGAREEASSSRKQATSDFAPADIVRHVGYLCRDELEGRLTGTRGEQLATAYVAAYLDSLGLKPAGDEGGWYQSFEFTSGVALGEQNSLAAGSTSYQLNKDWRPLSFSGVGDVKPAPVAFAGYGMSVPKTDKIEEYDSYVHLDVEDKWVLVFRYMPENLPADKRQHLSRASQLRFKATFARDRGARGLIIVTGPTAQAKSELVPLRLDGTLAGSSLPVISVSNRVAAEWFAMSGKNLQEVQKKHDTGDLVMGFELEGVKLGASISVKRLKSQGRNVLGRLQAGDKPSQQAVIVGAHVDHLGKGANSSSLARDDESNLIHYGADDNASGVAAMLEVAEYLSDQRERGKLKMKRDVIFAAWSGEELGLIGSNHFVKALAHQFTSHHHGHAHDQAAPAPKKNVQQPLKQPSANNGPVKPRQATIDQAVAKGSTAPVKPAAPGHGSGAGASRGHTSGGHGTSHGIYPAIAACINMDMIGRLKSSLVLQGVGSSSIWKSEIERRNAPIGLPITLQEDSYLPTDASSFYMQGVPVLSAFTGSHSEYHTPRDTPDTLNYEGAAQVAKFMGLVTRSLAMRADAPDYIAQQAPEQGQRRARLRAYLGTIPDYAEEVKGVKLGGATKGGPADKAGIKAGDIVVELGGKKIENIYDYTFAIEALKVGQKVKVVVQRKGKRIELELIPGSRD